MLAVLDRGERLPTHYEAPFGVWRFGDDLTLVAQQLSADHKDYVARDLTGWPAWDPFRFIDLVEISERGQSGAGDFLAEVQRVEWELLFESCYRAAVGS